MPIWDVVCDKCNKTEEVLVVHSQDIPDCDCGGKRSKRPAAPMFEIHGWSEANGYCDEGIAYEHCID